MGDSKGVRDNGFAPVELSDVLHEAEEKKKSSALSVSAAMNLAKGALENVRVRIVGEVSEVSVKAGYKAAYFTIKDEDATLPCMMWLSRYRTSGVQLRVGQLVEITGRFSLYAAKGRMNFDVSSIALTGEGELRMRVAAIARKLEAEGLTSPARKRPLPELPQAIGVVTSPRGAAVHDVLRTLRRRFPLAQVLLAGVPVEGVTAPAGLIEGLRTVVAAGAEVVLVVRGGGSFEDLMPFNDEGLARAIAACPVPVVTGIGHEPDTSIADMVADRRASTPTAAAEAVSPGMDVLNDQVMLRGKRMHDVLARRLELSVVALQRRADRPCLSDPMSLIGRWAQDLDAQSDRLSRALPLTMERNQASLQNARQRLLLAAPGLTRDAAQRLERSRGTLASSLTRLTQVPEQHVSAGASRLVASGPALVKRFQSEVGLAASRLNDLSPLAVLGRGYSISRDAHGSIVKSIEQAPVGTAVEVTVADGTLSCEVTALHPQESH